MVIVAVNSQQEAPASVGRNLKCGVLPMTKKAARFDATGVEAQSLLGECAQAANLCEVTCLVKRHLHPPTEISLEAASTISTASASKIRAWGIQQSDFSVATSAPHRHSLLGPSQPSIPEHPASRFTFVWSVRLRPSSRLMM